jgi:hypothetical protein
MRRPRHRLQVSTFPFLAVLLCTMGSLILVLLVIDRRAKAAARVRALQAAYKVIEEEETVAAARRAEWERRRAALHAALAEQVAQVRSQVEAVQHKSGDAASSLQSFAARLRGLRDRVQTERSTLAKTEQALGTQRSTVAENSKLSEAAQAQLRRIAADLDALERVLADLKAARQRQQSSYSVVPYRGKHGDARKPLYIECSGTGLVFHPDHEKLDGYILSPLDIRSTLERRLERHRLVTLKADPREGKPYLLMLLRPSGIGNYYRTLSGLAGLDVDFGYELVDEDWAFEFPEDDRDPPSQPWMSARVPNPAAPEGPSRMTPDGTRISGPWLATPGEGNGPGGSGGVASGVPLIRRGPLGGGTFDPYHPPQYVGGLRGLGTGSGSGRGFGPGGPGTALQNNAQAFVGTMPGAGRYGPGGPFPGPGSANSGPGPPSGVPGGRYPGTSGTGPGPRGVGPGSSGTPGGNGQPGSIIAQAGMRSGNGFGGPPGTPGNGTSGTGPGGGVDPIHAPLRSGEGPAGGNTETGNAAAGSSPPGTAANGKPGTADGSVPTGTGARTPDANPSPYWQSEAARFASGGSPNGGAPSSGSPGGASGPAAPGATATASSPRGGGAGSDGGGGSSGPAGSGAVGALEGGAAVPGNGLPAGVPTAAGAVIPRAPGATPDDNGPPPRPPTDPSANFSPGGSGPRGGGNSGAPSDGPPDPFHRLTPPVAGGKRSAPVDPRPPERRTGNRDFIIRIECAGDGVIAPAGGSHQISLSALQRGDGTVQLQRLVSEMIDRRQATVRSGEAAFRPQVRFLIRPDGQKTYWLAWPALEALKVPMTCANIGRDDSVEH